MSSGRLGKASVQANTNTTLYVVPNGTVATANICLVNTGTALLKVRVAICATATPAATDWIEYDGALSPFQSVERTAVALSAGEYVVVRSDGTGLNVRVHGFEVSDQISTPSPSPAPAPSPTPGPTPSPSPSPGPVTTYAKYLAIGFPNSDQLKVFGQNVDTLTDLAVTTPTGLRTTAASFSPDGTYLATYAENGSSSLYVYKRSGNTFTSLNTLSAPLDGREQAGGVAFSGTGTYLAAGSRSGAAGPVSDLKVYKRTGDNFTDLGVVTSGIDRILAVGFSSDDTYLVVGHRGPGGATILKRSGDVFTALSNPFSVPITNSGECVCWTADMTYLAIGSNNVQVFKRSGDVFTLIFTSNITGVANSSGVFGSRLSFSPDGTYLAYGHNGGENLTIFKRAADVFTKLTSPTVLPAEDAHGVCFSGDGLYLAVTMDNDARRYLVYKRTGDTFAPITVPAVSGNTATAAYYPVAVPGSR